MQTFSLNELWVCFPGWATDCQIFAPYIPQENRYEIDYHYFSEGDFPDINGIKKSIQNLNAENINFIGYSLGSMHALALAEFFPVKKMILFSPFKNFMEREDRKAALFLRKKIGLMQKQLKNSASGTINNFYTEASSPNKSLFSPHDFYNTQALHDGLECLKTYNIAESAKKRENQTLIFSGEDDSIVDQFQIEAIKTLLSNPEFHKKKNTGHGIVLDSIEHCSRIIGSF